MVRLGESSIRILKVKCLSRPLRRIIRFPETKLRVAARRGYNRGMTVWQQHLGSDPSICEGDFCARGTRIPVTVILDNLAEGASRDEILQSYPTLRLEHIDAALAYAAELAHEERLIPLQAG
jgi:uncharacterized protein (DUF433 family)